MKRSIICPKYPLHFGIGSVGTSGACQPSWGRHGSALETQRHPFQLGHSWAVGPWSASVSSSMKWADATGAHQGQCEPRLTQYLALKAAKYTLGEVPGYRLKPRGHPPPPHPVLGSFPRSQPQSSVVSASSYGSPAQWFQ